MGNTCLSVVPLQHLLLAIVITALFLVSALKYNVDFCFIMFQNLVRVD